MRVGDTVGGRYVLEQEISGGGMSTVFRAWDLAGERLVAVKVLDDLRPDDIARFQREVSLLAEVRDSRVVAYLDHGSAANAQYLVMEWLEGETLTARLRDIGLSVREAVDVVHRICLALAPLHARGVVHRDVKPDNLVLDGGRVDGLKLIDLGLARSAWAHAPRVTATGVMVGTPGYMAPEQARGERTIDQRADIFALGCVFYECVTGYPAFAGENHLAVQSKILLVDPPPAHLLAPGLPDELGALLARMLAKTCDDRPGSVADVARALAELGALPDLPRRRSTPSQPDTLPMRRRAGTTTPDRVRGIVLARRRHQAVLDRRTPTVAQIDRRDAALRAAVTDQGGSLEVLEDDSLVATFVADAAIEPVPDRAARAALALRPLLADSTIALVTGIRAIEELVDRAAAEVEAAARVAAFSADHAGAIAVDGATAQALAARFEVCSIRGGWRLSAERSG